MKIVCFFSNSFKLVYTDENGHIHNLKFEKCYDALAGPRYRPAPQVSLKIYPFPPVTHGGTGAPRIPHSVLGSSTPPPLHWRGLGLNENKPVYSFQSPPHAPRSVYYLVLKLDRG